MKFKILEASSNVVNILKYKNVYDWNLIPLKYNYCATNESGFAFAYVGEPISGWLHTGFWYGGGKGKFIYWSHENPFKGDWRDSLEKRPVFY